ncbi:hypothetical protein [Flavobacterium collinsii]|jgi:hypothetical protein|uniref:Uncharacterized protein n=1 Tax=Flavobacterium collinsii TaxID=1114861 RepID=A0A9W4TGL7_9FLAO|nr:hypothetical protein [Flavobacterium collinsii]CAI2766811.1 conserved protein of unknown function [Flavobacterium collinsii]
MTLFNFLFKKSNSRCPRCLGKGFVDWEDIKRLNNQLKWAPGPCAYCNASGKATEEMLSNVAVNTTYLTIDLPESEIEKIKNGDEETIEKGKLQELFVESIIKYTEYHYLNKNMDAQSIADLYLSTENEKAPFSVEKENLIQYISKIIELKKTEQK